MPPIPPVLGMCRRHTKEQQCGNTTKIANEKAGEVPTFNYLQLPKAA